ncbi:response regulator transcription factor [Massilibacterium senegalense]|uniref:response regulator transcription factor n=1 Tax=Massilibacterium senegalense TaxID=1632858 RepID=UPI0007819E59|nr:response regulator transcription factor [Massilibacterium senegalense]
MTHILVADDDQHTLQLIALHLAKEPYEVSLAKDGHEAMHILQTTPIDLAILDVMMPFKNGYELTTYIREHSHIPVLLLTAKGELKDKEKGFLAGTDDYMVKPFEAKELLFRIKALLRRYPSQNEDVIQLGEMTIDKKSFEVCLPKQTLLLPLKEFELLVYLATYKKQVLSREQIIESIWGLDFKGDVRTVDVHIKRLRERLKGRVKNVTIKTVRGVGYMLEG